MSTVRMCDRCGNIFSEREDGWGAMQATTVKRNKEGRLVEQTEHLDACPSCYGGGEFVPRPRLAELSAHEPAGDK